ncbi:MAG TPA: methyltransferase domain-containing protein [Mycobacteriales bacterium]|nr:methyltransferase domain-containing protein [Mycobacteriales bacterium]
MTDWRPKAADLAHQLSAAGLVDARWKKAFQETPRHVFVPFFYRSGTRIDGSDPVQAAEWLGSVYSDQTLTIQHGQVPGVDQPWPTSSSTKPSLMARMLGLLDVTDRHRVMEVGTGSGYNAALLCHRLGDTAVASVDIHPELTAAARDRLRQLNYQPHLVAGDGTHGAPNNAPYDRIVATCAVPAIPGAWITQLNTAGIIVADVRGDISSSLIALHKTDPHTVEGRFLPISGHFMWLRSHVGDPVPDGHGFTTCLDLAGAEQGNTRLNPALLDNWDFRFILQLHDPALQSAGRITRDGIELYSLICIDSSWAEIHTAPGPNDCYPIIQGGPRRIVDSTESTAHAWTELGRPSRDRYGLTATTDKQHIWLDHPDSPHFWPLTPPRQPSR